ncbi:DUF2806 domain-containing protein [Pendulispora rubella]|uniref:DUF2806 domain-containing protein n=1 Tax=Pendulispora rubella TaxID=2741070 RepID=A0ABZ2KYJ2_9BACT
MDPDAINKAVAAAGKPLEKLVDVVSAGMGHVTRPFLVVINAYADGKANLIRQAYAHRMERLQAQHSAQLAELQEPKAPALRPKPEEPLDIDVVFEEAEPSELLAARFMETEQQGRRRANLITIAAEAADNLPPHVSDEPVDPDWIERFFANAKDVSREDLQRLWGKLLAAEVAQPSRVPLRTLDTLRNLTVNEAKLLHKAASFLAVGYVYVIVGPDAPDDARLSGAELATLQDAGIFESPSRPLWMDPLKSSDIDFNAAEKRFGDRYLLHPGAEKQAYQQSVLVYRTGHKLIIQWANSGIIPPNFFLVRPSAMPLFDIIANTTSLTYLRYLVTSINKHEFYQAWIQEPSNWEGERLGKETAPPAPEGTPDS